MLSLKQKNFSSHLKLRKMDLSQVIIAPVITEKTHAKQVSAKYVFKINKNANKIEVKQAIEKFYGIKPSSVNITLMQPKKRTVGRGNVIQKRKALKKAVITLPKGKTIDITKFTKGKKK